MRPIPPTCARQPDPLYPPFRGRALPPGAIPSLSLAAPLHYYLATSSFLCAFFDLIHFRDCS